MRIEKIQIENFRGFTSLDLAFEPDLNVFIGPNGAGKSSLLSALIKNIVFYIKSHISPKDFTLDLELNEKDINYKETFCGVWTTLTDNLNENVLTSIAYPNEIDNFSDNTTQGGMEFFQKILDQELDNIPIFKYFSASRRRLEYAEVSNIVYKRSQVEAWGNVVQNNRSYSRFLNWFFDYENKELRLKRDHNDFSYEEPNLKYVRDAIKKLLKYLYDKDYIVGTSQRQRAGNNDLIPTITLRENKEGSVAEDLEFKSDGEKSVITMVADIAYNISIANNPDNTEKQSSGIVLIDEIEAHLHPTWQRKIIPILRHIFPNIQFFITTHSPQVISSVNSDKVFLVDNFQIEKINFQSKGVDSNTLLKYVFNSTERPKEYIELIKKFDKLIEEQKSIEELEAVIKEVEQLEQEDQGQTISMLVEELTLQLGAYKFELEHEND